MKKTKLLTFTLASGLLFGACSNNHTEQETSTDNTTEPTSQTDTVYVTGIIKGHGHREYVARAELMNKKGETYHTYAVCDNDILLYSERSDTLVVTKMPIKRPNCVIEDHWIVVENITAKHLKENWLSQQKQH